MQIDDLILVSVDDHIVESPSLHDFFVDHVPAKYRDRVPKVIRRDDGTDAWLIEGREIFSFGLNAVMGRAPEEWGNDPANFDQVRPGTYDVHERVRDMDANGVLASMDFSSWPGLGGQFFAASDDIEYVAAMIRAYNDWHLDAWCCEYPGRFLPLALSGFTLGPSPVMRTFPEVKIALAEGGIGWIPHLLERADVTYQKHHHWTGQHFDELPSQNFKRRVLTCFIEDRTALKLRHDIGIENIAWECDYPHSDSTWPHAPELLMKAFDAVGV